MDNQNYIQWLLSNTKTTWWHDSADPKELSFGIKHGASGVTTNPVLVNTTLITNQRYWSNKMNKYLSSDQSPQERAEALMKVVVKDIAEKLIPEFERSGGHSGFVCAQIDPSLAGERESMISMIERFHSWAPNIAVKLPVTAAGLDAMEMCISRGITVTATVSFTVPQVIAIAERHRKGILRAKKNGKKPGNCFAVIMIGRLDDYLRDCAKDSGAAIEEDDIRKAGLAVTKKAYSIYKDLGYQAKLIVAALRGTYHLTELAGADLIMSIHPKYQYQFLSPDIPFEQRILEQLDPSVFRRLSKLPEFVRAYEPSGMMPEEFITFGATQRTLSQFSEIGWKQLTRFNTK